MKKNLFKKGLIIGLIALLIGISFTQIITGNELFFNKSNCFITSSNKELRNIMLTGYWNPTGQMIAPFSDDTYLNPNGWKGENWENLGYNIYSYFPKPFTYNGTFEVDYQNTWDDFWSITDEIKPIAIISFGAGNGPWEIEYNARNLNSWIPDNKPPYQPTPCPPDSSVPPNFVRHSTLPVQDIADAVNSQTSVNAWIDWSGNPGAYLCEYMAYLGMWYQDLHNETGDPYRCCKAGFIHVRSSVNLPDAMEATNITIREIIKSIVNYPPNRPIIDGPSEGYIRTEYTFTFTATDPDNDDVYYEIDWDDSNLEEGGPYTSGKIITINHTWSEVGTYTIKAKATDIHGLESDQTSFELIIKKSKPFQSRIVNKLVTNLNYFPILERLLKRLGK